MKIVWDVDEVLVNLRCKVSRELGADENHRHHWKNWKVYNGVSIDKTPDEFKDFLIEKRCLEDSDIEPFAETVLRTSKEAGYKNILVTARGWHPNGKKATEEYFSKHGLIDLIDDIHVVDITEKKHTVIKSLGYVDYYIDDSSYHINDASNYADVGQCFLINMPWNENYKLGPNEYRYNGISDLPITFFSNSFNR